MASTRPRRSRKALAAATSVKVFVSYSHDPLSVDAVAEKRERDRLRALHRAHALDLAEYLRRHGIDGRIDQYREDDPPDSWPQWMERQIVECDYVLMVCTPSYFHYVTQEADEGSERGLGSRFEGRIIYGYLTKKPTARKFIPIFFGPRQPKYIPHVIAQSASYQVLFPLDMDMPEQRDLWRLYAKLTGQLTSELTPIGKKRKLEARSGPVAKDQREESMDWCLDLTAEDLDLDGDKVRLKEVKLQKASGSAVFSFEYIEDVELVFNSFIFLFDLKEAMKLSHIHGVCVRYMKVEGSVEVEDSTGPLHGDLVLICSLTVDKDTGSSAALMTENFSSQKIIYDFSFEKSLRKDATLKVYEASCAPKQGLKKSLKCTLKNLKTSVCAGIIKK